MQSGQTHHSPGPKDGVVHHEPGLLAEASQGLAAGDSLESTNGGQNVLHEAGAEASEEDDAEGDEVGIIETDAVLAGSGVVVAEVEELVRVFPSLGDKGLGEENEGEEVEGETYRKKQSARVLCIIDERVKIHPSMSANPNTRTGRTRRGTDTDARSKLGGLSPNERWHWIALRAGPLRLERKW